MSEISDKLITFISEGNYLIGIMLLGIGIIINIPKIKEFIDSIKKQRINNITEAMQTKQLSEVTTKFLSEKLETEYFYLITGIYAEKPLRDKIIVTHQNANGKLRFKMIEKGFEHLEIENNELTVKFSPLDKIYYLYNFINGILFFMAGLFLLSYSLIFFDAASTIKIISLTSIGLVLLPIGVSMLFMVLPFFSAKKIKKFLSKNDT